MADVLTSAEAGFLDAARVAHLATSGDAGRPHVVPICPVLDLNRVVLATERETVKVRNIEENDRVALCVDDYSEDWASGLRGLVVHGAATIIESGPEWERDRALLYEKFPQYPTDAAIEEGSTLIVEVRIDAVSSWGLDA